LPTSRRSLEKLTQGKTDIELSGIGRADQVGRLSGAVRSFRDTLTRLREAESELRELNGDLEQKIDARTHELKLTMQVARDSQRKVQAIVDTALDAVVRHGPQRAHRRLEPAGRNHLRLEREEALGQQLEPLIIPQRYRYDHRKAMQRYVAAAPAAAKCWTAVSKSMRCAADGSEFPIELSITRVMLDERR
jgi:two-component system sensor histidine kinase/response regulator